MTNKEILLPLPLIRTERRSSGGKGQGEREVFDKSLGKGNIPELKRRRHYVNRCKKRR